MKRSFDLLQCCSNIVMKYILFSYFGIILLTKAKCHVTNPIKTLEGSTVPVEPKNDNSKFKESKSATSEIGKVYLEDVVFALKNQNWTAEEIPCLNDTLLLIRSLQNFTLWAVWDWDSMSSQPEGLLFGNQYELGNFDECMNTPWSDSGLVPQTQYCLAEIELERTDKALRKKVLQPVNPYQSALDYMQYRPSHSRPLHKLTWGACVPAACPLRSVERLMRIMLARSYLGMAGIRPRISVTEPCQRADQPREYQPSFYAFVTLCGTLAAIALTCTYLNSIRDKSKPETIKNEIISAFCLKENMKNLLEMKKEGTEVFYGIRFITICFIVMSHQLGMFNAGPVSDGARADKDALSTLGMFVLHNDLFVDTFFLMSGFFVATALKGYKRIPNPIFMILKRYVRLVVAFAIVIFFVAAVFPHTGSGPLWNRGVADETGPCQRNWWLSLLMLGNYVDNENICIVISWYIPCDFHYFVVTVIVYWLYRHNRNLGLCCAGVLTVASVVLPGVITYTNDLPAVQLFTYAFVKNPRASQQFHLTYIKSHTRFSAYAIGFFSGYFYATCRSADTVPRVFKKWSSLGAGTGLVIMTVVLIIGPTYLWRSYSPLEGAVYASVNRPVWAGGLVLLVLSCCLGYVPFIKRFLSWYPWAPLSKLAYGLYVTHSLIIIRNVLVARNPRQNDYFGLFIQAAGVIVLGSVLALVLWLVAEAPINKLLIICLKPRKKQHSSSDKETNVTPSTQTSGISIIGESSGYMHVNLPTTVQLSSKI